MVETFNNYIMRTRSKHLIDMLKEIRTILIKRLVTKREEANKWAGLLCPKIQKLLEKEKGYLKEFIFDEFEGILQNLKSVRGYHDPKPCYPECVWLAMQNCLATKDRLIRWMTDCHSDCALCNGGSESLNHLMLKCPDGREIYDGAFSYLEKVWEVDTFEEEIKLINKINRKNTDKAKLISVSLLCRDALLGNWNHNKPSFFCTSPFWLVVKSTI
ncbi:uncharacterized protein LOC130800983 [Amaranthus tricolor]|uniref:uncharacterized protein LOC130800983 n=1 Tax=Amaranthus tricolor TaxID=29722 RepID=UPI0025848363|nr:uncharacterized protein LOC130800983 [Amaranthus tricolor]